MLIYQTSNNCSVLNVSSLVWHKNFKFINQEYILMCILMPIIVIAMILNAFCLLVFKIQIFDNVAVKFSLITTAISEIVLLVAVLLKATMVISKIDHRHTIRSFIVSGWIHIFLNSCFCIRNWNVVMIAISRLEIICRPFVIFYKPIFSTMLLVRLEVVIVIISITLSIINNAHIKATVCNNYNAFVRLQLSFPTLGKWHEYYQVYVMFMFQTFVPISIILLASCGIFLKLKSTNELQIPQTGASRDRLKGDSGFALEKLLSKNPNSLISIRSILRTAGTDGRTTMRMKRNSNLKNIRNRRTTTYMVLFFSVIFCLFQSPTFIITCLFLHKKSWTFSIHPDVFSNCFNLFDSLSNVFIYAFSSRQFRKFSLLILKNRTLVNNRRKSTSFENHKISVQSNVIGN